MKNCRGTTSYPLDPARVAEISPRTISSISPVARVAELGEGWDFATFVVNDDWVFRFPKRRQAARQLARERQLLDALAPRSPTDQAIAIPRYRYLRRHAGCSRRCRMAAIRCCEEKR